MHGRHADVGIRVRGHVVLPLVAAGVRRGAIALAVRDGGRGRRGLLFLVLVRVGVGAGSVARTGVAAVAISVALDGGVSIVGGERYGQVFVVEGGRHGW